MNKFFTLILSFFFLISFEMAFAQNNVTSKIHLKYPPIAATQRGVETLHPNLAFHPSSHLAQSRNTEKEVFIGTTYYDAQSYGTIQNRLINRPEGTRSAVWTMSLDNSSTSFTDRGTGYNHFDGVEWGAYPTERLESIRTGWPLVNTTSDGSEQIVSHQVYGAPIFLGNSPSAPAFVQGNIPSNLEMLWPKSAVGGSDNNTLYVIAITRPVANTGVVYEGVDGHILFYRSPDGGVNWDKQDFIIPGLDSTSLRRIDADSYSMDAHGDDVAIAVFNSWDDLVLMVSHDRGDTWTQKIVYDFPLSHYTADQGYTTADIPADPNAPDSLAIFTNDGTGTVLIDNNGLVHVWFGAMYVTDINLTDNNTQYFPGMSGLMYWNETYPTDSIRLVADLKDYNGDLSVTLTDTLAIYYSSLTSTPSAGIDDQGNIYVAFMSASEFFISTSEHQNFRHVLVIASTDGGETWSDSYDIINQDIVPDAFEYVETAFPCVARHVDDKLHIIYQEDELAGLNVLGDLDPITQNYIAYVALDVHEAFGIPSGVKQPLNSSQALLLYPNPAFESAKLSCEIKQAGDVSIQVSNLLGELKWKDQAKNVQVGMFEKSIGLNGLANGVYWVTIRTDNEQFAGKLVIQR